MSILLDSKKHPSLFCWAGQISPEALEQWLCERGYSIPDDLRTFWERTGGGDVFETESILGPFRDAEMGDDVDSSNENHRARGLSERMLVIHEGAAGLTVVDLVTGEYRLLEENTYEVQETFSTMDEWYASTLRLEYAERYAMGSPG